IVGNIDHVAAVRGSDAAVLDSIQLSSFGDGYYHRAIVVVGHYAYVVGEMTGKRPGLVTIDLQYLPDSLHFVGNNTVSGTMLRCHELDLDRGRPYLYMEADEWLGQNGIEVFDITDPENPNKVAFMPVMSTHDMTARNDTVWVAEGYAHAFSVWDMANKSNPILLGRITDPNFGYTHGIYPSDDGKYFFTTEETPNKTVKVWDAHDMNNIFMRGQYLGGNNLAHNVYVMGDLLVFSHYTSGVTIVDWSDPDNLVEIASYDTYPQNDVSNFYGTWAAYPWTSDSSIYASNFEGKLFILDWDRNAVGTDAPQPRVEGQPWPNPFTAVTNIPLKLSHVAHVSVDIFDHQGRHLETLEDGELAAGSYTLPWHANTDMAAGHYFAVVRVDGAPQTHHLVYRGAGK
ncbi:MAG: choice-of-anchor B family protein, partial [Bacteroidia bacterium]